MGGWSKLGLLLWKNWKLSIRHPFHLALMLAIPLIGAIIILCLKVMVGSLYYDVHTYYDVDPLILWGETNDLSSKNIKIVWTANGDSNFKERAHRVMRALEDREIKLVEVKSEADLKEYLKQPNIMKVSYNDPFVLCGVVLEGSQKFCEKLKMNLMFPALTRFRPIIPWPTGKRYSYTGPTVHISMYDVECFVNVQALISTSIAHECGGNELSNAASGIRVRKFPHQYRYSRAAQTRYSLIITTFLMVAFFVPFTNMVKEITREREYQLKESMKIIGLPNFLHWSAWFIKSMILLLIVICIIVFWWTITIHHISVLEWSDGSILFVLLFIYAMATTCLSFLVSVIFKRAHVAAIAGGLIWIATYFPGGLITQDFDTIGFTYKILVCLMSNSALILGVVVILDSEVYSRGIHWTNICRVVTLHNDMSMACVFLMLLFDSALYLLLALYIECIFPGASGISKPWYFLFEREYWFRERVEADISISRKYFLKDPRYFEPEPIDGIAGVKLSHVRKVYHEKIVPVSDVSLNIYEDQITVLLGNNSSGKTTVMKLITGIEKPTSGTIVVQGYDIVKDPNAARANMSICLQHNLLFDELTVTEHMFFFTKLKGLPEKQTYSDINRYITILDLEREKDTEIQHLSGGCKRRVALACALCGRPKVVLLDEPTEGMDGSARQTFWNVIRSEKEGRTILLTTQIMSEADTLGDRIAIMANGKVISCGSPFFLKRRCESGYKLVVEKGVDCKTASVTALLHRYIKPLSPSEERDQEVIYRLNEDMTPLFYPMLRDLEENSQQLDVISYGISAPNMEDVFIKNMEREEKHSSDTSLNISTTESIQDMKMLQIELFRGRKLLQSRFFGIFYKNQVIFKRNFPLYIFHCILPFSMYIFLQLIYRSGKVARDPPSVNIRLKYYEKPETLVVMEQHDQSLPSDIGMSMYQLYKEIIYERGSELHDLGHKKEPLKAFHKYMLQKFSSDEKGTLDHYIVAASFLRKTYTGWYQIRAAHALPISYNLLINALLRNISMSLEVINTPMPLTATEKKLYELGYFRERFITFPLALVLGILAAGFIVLPIRERISKWKHLQLVAGVGGFTYWISHFVWSFAFFVLPLLLLTIVISVYKDMEFTTARQAGECFLLFVLFAWAILPFIFILSFAFDWIVIGYSVIVLFISFFEITYEFVALEPMHYEVFYDYLIFFPNFCFFGALRKLISHNLNKEECEIRKQFCSAAKEDFCCPGKCPENGCWKIVDNMYQIGPDGIGRNIVILVFSNFFYFGILIMIEYRQYFTRKRREPHKRRHQEPDERHLDSDVLGERQLILSYSVAELREKYSLCLSNVSKYYKKFLAVDHVFLGVEKGECFGLLGANGAGKTTTFQIMTGDLQSYYGDAYILGWKITKHDKVFGHIGYCPQFDAVYPNVTGREALFMYCLLRGIPRKNIEQIILEITNLMQFTQFLDKQVKTYSGGTKRKLSTALALLGKPKMIFLDEPTARLDPMARKSVWSILKSIRDLGTSVVFTSQSMDECEAICTRIVIMVNGQLKCLGTLQHLKNKFNQGFVLQIKVRGDLEMKSDRIEDSVVGSVNDVKWFVDKTFPGSVLRDEYSTLLVYLLMNPDLKYSDIFAVMEEAKTVFNIEDYYLSQTNLQQVFLTFAKHQITSSDD